ncbi:adenosylcobinamide-GDP ribazoletransferase [Methylocystis sp. IM3]|uniref:adenosylcobinamide-GDP ribazoletransferase n=1 Tax=unclassified Methylocystis TaxID=2625913 RepID=UPI000FA9FF89|nr:MAG: adenosylcobinamide-GDP ribazoletransferase [Hyphomicrobiales bacterium]
MIPTIGDDIRACLRFYSRLPVRAGVDGHAMPDFSRVSWATPVAGAAIGALGSAVLLLSAIVHLPPIVAAATAVAVLSLSTGALHEDGLADVADGFGGGATREQKLAIMRDSRLGTYGTLALCLSTLVRVGAIGALCERGALSAAIAIVAASALSRAVGLIPLVISLPARGDGAGSSAATPSAPALRVALYLGCAIALTPALGPASLAQTVVAVMAAFGGAIAITKMAQLQIGGYTGDVLGAAQQVSEVAMLVALSAG